MERQEVIQLDSTRSAVTVADHEAALRAANEGSALRSQRGVRMGWIWEWAKVFPIALALFLVLRSFLVEAYKIPSGSMERTLLVGDFLLVNKLVYGAQIPFTERHLPAIRTPQHGDIVVFEWPVDPSKNFVKRLVGLPGDTLSMRDGQLRRNGELVAEQYVVRSHPAVDPVTDEFRWQRSYLVKTAVAAPVERYRPTRDNWGPIVVPPHRYFMLGDNRDDSLDSRYWGFVPDNLVRGTPMVVYYSYEAESSNPMPWLTRIRWRRLGDLVR